MIPKTWTSDSVDTNGIKLHFHRTGNQTSGDKPVLICAHGITDNGLCWLRLALALEAHFDLIMVDARGHGQSDAPDDGYNPADHAADLAGLIDALDLQKPHLIGHSMGAATVAAFGANYPDLPGKIALEDPPWWPQVTAAEQAEFDEGRRASMEQRRERMAAYQQQSADEIIADGREVNPLWDDIEFGPWSLAKRQVSANAMGFKMPVHWSDLVPKFRCDTLLITGDVEIGALVSPQLAAQTQTLNDRVAHVHIPKAGHNIRRDQFDLYREAVVAFL